MYKVGVKTEMNYSKFKFSNIFHSFGSGFLHKLWRQRVVSRLSNKTIVILRKKSDAIWSIIFILHMYSNCFRFRLCSTPTIIEKNVSMVL